MTGKEILREKFSSNFTKYYEVELFRREGFERKSCISCRKYFWTMDDARKNCPEQPCQQYEFIGNPPAKKKFDYLETWNQVEKFFKSNGHTSVSRYPVVARWRPDLFFTVASIVDFQRIEGGKVVFDLPYNPLIVPQTCLRFNDISNVGVSGKHFTSFVMIGQHSIANDDGYWKDTCIDLDFDLLTGPFGIPREELIFKEDVWVGYGAFGYSLEYYVRGLELGNAVFTEFEGTPDNYHVMKEKIIDMGAGLERLSWITQGTPTAYQAVFGPVVDKIVEKCEITYDEQFFEAYSRMAGTLNLDEVPDIRAARMQVAKNLGISSKDLTDKVSPIEAMYAIADHVKSLIFAIADGALPSNVGGGYNLRVILRRALGLIGRHRWPIKLEDIANWHIDYLSRMYPELDNHRDEVTTILRVEEKRYHSTQERTSKIVDGILRSGTDVAEHDLIRLYESEGVTPELLKEKGLDIDVPPDFYAKITESHVTQRADDKVSKLEVDGLGKTRTLFYENQDLSDFEAKVLKVFPNTDSNLVVLDQTAFYARAGGQEPDHGVINGNEVLDVEKYGDIIIHKIKGKPLREGALVKCSVDMRRRRILTRHHTATHVVLGAAKRALGSWVWQASAYKDIDKARLDITHYEHLSMSKIHEIENLANQAVRMNIPVHKLVLERSDAEERYGFTIYQGGIVPGRTLRVQDIEDWDVEACAGTHVSRTGEIGMIKIIRNERVQDGVERLEYVAGDVAMEHVQSQDVMISRIAESLGAQQEKLLESVKNIKDQNEDMRRKIKQLPRRLSETLIKDLVESAQDIKGIHVQVVDWDEVDEDFHITIGEKAVSKVPTLIYLGIINTGNHSRLLLFSGEDAQSRGINAGELVRDISKQFGGSGGGNPKFGQGGGSERPDVSLVLKEIAKRIES